MKSSKRIKTMLFGLTVLISMQLNHAQAAIIVSAPVKSSATVSTNSCFGLGPKNQTVSDSTTAYNLFVGNTSPICYAGSLSGAQYASAAGDPAAGSFATTAVVSRSALTPGNSTWESTASSVTSFTLVNNAAVAQTVRATNAIDAGAVLIQAFAPRLNTPYSLTEDMTARVEFKMSLDGVVVNQGSARFARSTGLDFSRQNPLDITSFSRSGVFLNVPNPSAGLVSNALGNYWRGLTWADFLVDTDLGSFAPSASKVLSIEVLSFSRARVSADITRGTSVPNQMAEVYASIGDPLSLSSPSYPTFTVVNGGPDVPPNSVPVAPSILLMCIGFVSLLVAKRSKSRST